MIFHLPRVLSGDQVRAIRTVLDSSVFVDGMQTGGVYVRNIKNNREIDADSEPARRLNTLIQGALKANNDFQIVAIPFRISPFIFSSYTPGLSYGDHTDNAIMSKGSDPLRSDVAMTIFLSDPSAYEGGELLIDTDIRPSAWKLPAGDALVYPSFSLHRVDPIRSGERRVAVTWIQSHVRLPQHRQTLIDIAQVMSWMLKTLPEGRAHEHPEFRRLDKVRANLTRLWAEF
ncbi:MAG: Fe2+-dependent dioxygenase [Alphaproteobacteria bacterium]